MCLCALALRVAHHASTSSYTHTYYVFVCVSAARSAPYSCYILIHILLPLFLPLFLTLFLKHSRVEGSPSFLGSPSPKNICTRSHEMYNDDDDDARCYETHTHTHTDNDTLLLLYYPTALLPLLLSFLGDPRSLTRTSARAILEDVSCLRSYIGIMQAHTRATMLLRRVFYGDPKLKC